MTIKSTIAAVFFVCAANLPASAVTMDFTGLVNFQNYSQNGLNMTSDNVWNYPGSDMAHMDAGTAVFQLATLADFNLVSVDLLSANSSGPGPARFSAFNNGAFIGSVDIAPLPAATITFIFGAAFQGIDEFRVTVPVTHFTYDNINFGAAAVPGPIVGAGLPGLIAAFGALVALARRRRVGASISSGA